MEPTRPAAEVLLAGCAVDGAGLHCAPAAVVLRHGVVQAVGAPEHIGSVAGAAVRHLPGTVLMPPFANAHAHLDLSRITGLQQVMREQGFWAWLDRVRTGRPNDEAGLRDAVARGIELSRAGGVAWVGDIAGRQSMASFESLASSPMEGVSYIEVFGLCGERQRQAVEFLRSLQPRSKGGVRLGVSPHAPYSAGPRTYEAALALDMPFSSHVAESPEEVAFTERLEGPLMEFARSMGALCPGQACEGMHPLPWFLQRLPAARHQPVSIAHVNEVEPGMLDRLAESGAVVLYCPRSNAYFGRPGPEGALHRWREMLGAGVRVALCTDGLPSLDREDRITPLDDARLLWRRGDVHAELLLEMISLEGLAAMGIPADEAVLGAGARHGLLGFEVAEPARGFEAVLACDAAPTWVSHTVGTRIA